MILLLILLSDLNEQEDAMQLMPSLQVKQKQSLVMTPQLQQAIKLLQMTNLDLSLIHI